MLIPWFGIGEATQLAVIILASFFPVSLNARAGFARLDASFRERAASLSLSRLDYARWFVWPAAFLSIVTGVRLSFGYSWRALIAAELIAAGGCILDGVERRSRAGREGRCLQESIMPAEGAPAALSGQDGHGRRV